MKGQIYQLFLLHKLGPQNHTACKFYKTFRPNSLIAIFLYNLKRHLIHAFFNQKFQKEHFINFCESHIIYLLQITVQGIVIGMCCIVFQDFFAYTMAVFFPEFRHLSSMLITAKIFYANLTFTTTDRKNKSRKCYIQSCTLFYIIRFIHQLLKIIIHRRHIPSFFVIFKQYSGICVI